MATIARIKTDQPSRAWARRAAEHTRGRGPHRTLKAALLDIGGWAACVPVVEPDLEKILKRGRRFAGKSTTMRGEPCSCHANSSALWSENRDRCSICTGYALSRDGMWRQHSWVYTHDGIVVETTEKRVQYFGFIMSPAECEQFCDANF